MQHLILTNPCSENWDDMQPSKIGRYCDTCTKHVVDLTTKTDVELIAFFHRKKDNVCGRLLSTQLHRELVKPAKQNHWQWLLPVALGAIAFTPAKASELRPVTMQQNALAPSFPENNKPPLNKDKIVDTIMGKVLDQTTGNPLAGVKISRKGFKNVIATTDTAGNFTLTLAEAERINPLVFTHDRYDRIEQGISSKMLVKLKKEIIIRLGGVHSITTNNKPLYIISSGKQSCVANDLQSNGISPEWIEKIEILKDAASTAIYGIRGANGVILVEIKKEYAKRIDFSKKH